MISSRTADSGQASLEFVVGATLFLLALFTGLMILLHAMGALILTKWAAENSRCVAKNISQTDCRDKIQKELRDYFAFNRVTVKTRTVRGVIHSEVTGTLVDETTILGTYDLEPSEYKRVSQ